MMPPEAPTMKYLYGNQEEEFVFCHKGRPFAILMSPHLPTPSSTFIDHHLVKELKLKMTDLQCKKLSYCGKKLRILGKVSCTIQCVKEGNTVGNFFLKASVVEDLKEHFDTHGIAGNKMAAILQGDDVKSINCTSSGAPSPARSDTSTGSGSDATIPSECSTPTRILLKNIAAGHQSPAEESPPRPVTPPRPATPPSPRRSPPGFPPSPRHQALLSPLSANKKKLGEMFHDADLEPHDHAQLSVLLHTDPGGQVTYDSNGVTTFLTSDGGRYMLGHGRDKCFQSLCLNGQSVPNNCVFASHWTYPINFQYCGQHCRGAFCSCLRQFR